MPFPELEQPDSNSYFLHYRDPQIEAYMDERFARYADGRRRWVKKSDIWQFANAYNGEVRLILDPERKYIPLAGGEMIIGYSSLKNVTTFSLGEMYHHQVQCFIPAMGKIFTFDERELGLYDKNYNLAALAFTRFIGFDKIIVYGRQSSRGFFNDHTIRFVNID